jgi:haloacetate dehalogenase
LNSWAATPEFWHPDAFDAYLANLSDPHCLAAACADYRANATLDLADDATSAADGQTVSCPALVLWGESPQSRGQAMLEIWRPFAPQITGTSIDAGHFLAEEMPSITAAALLAFLAALCAAHHGASAGHTRELILVALSAARAVGRNRVSIEAVAEEAA